MVLFEGSKDQRYAAVELKLIPAAINQSTTTNEYSQFTDSLALFTVLIASAANLTVLRFILIKSCL